MSGEERDVGCHGIVFSWKPEVRRAKALASLSCCGVAERKQVAERWKRLSFPPICPSL